MLMQGMTLQIVQLSNKEIIVYLMHWNNSDKNDKNVSFYIREADSSTIKVIKSNFNMFVHH